MLAPNQPGDMKRKGRMRSNRNRGYKTKKNAIEEKFDTHIFQIVK